MDWTPLIIALITAAGSIAGVIITNNRSNREMQASLDKTQSVFEAHVTEQIGSLRSDVERLESKQDKHNKLIERTYELEQEVKLNTAEINRHKERIKALEGNK